MHIVHVVEAFAAGVLSILADIANQQAHDGHHVTIVYGLRRETPTEWQRLFMPAVTCYPLAMVRDIRLPADIKATWQLYRLLTTLKPDVVHLHSSKAGALGRLVSIVYRRPRYFFSPHGLSFLQTAEGNVSQRFFLIVEKILAQLPVTIIACSNSEADAIRQRLTQRVKLVENAVDDKGIPTKTALNSILRIGTVGRICAQKNPELFAAIATACQPLPVEFIWIGAGDLTSTQLLAEAGVTVTGWLDRADVLTTLPTLDIYIQPSRWEGMPVAVIEAMLAGLPVVVSNVVGNKDLVMEGQTGFIADNLQAFIEAIDNLVNTPSRILTIGQAARTHARQRFSIDQMVSRLYQLYEGG